MTAKSLLSISALLFGLTLIPAAHAIESVQPTIQVLIEDDQLLKEGREAIHSGQLDQAVFYYEQALYRGQLSRKELIVVHSDLCVAYMYLERFDDAIKQCKKSIFMQPNRWESFNNLGTVYLVQGDYENALAVYEKALKMKPDSRILKFNYDLARKRSDMSAAERVNLKGPQINDGEADKGGVFDEAGTH